MLVLQGSCCASPEDITDNAHSGVWCGNEPLSFCLPSAHTDKDYNAICKLYFKNSPNLAYSINQMHHKFKCLQYILFQHYFTS